MALRLQPGTRRGARTGTQESGFQTPKPCDGKARTAFAILQRRFPPAKNIYLQAFPHCQSELGCLFRGHLRVKCVAVFEKVNYATSPASIKDAAVCVEKHLKGSGLNLLINNAGIYKEVALDTVDVEDMTSGFKTNLIGPLLVSQAFLPLLRRAAQESSQKGLSCNKAAIVNISSALGSIELVPLTIKSAIPYRCSKAALNMLTQCQSVGYKEDGILCTAVHPGWVKTEMGGQDADLTVDESARGILDVLSKLSDEHNGAFLSWKGSKMPW